MSNQRYLAYTALDDFLQVINKFVDCSSNAESWTYHSDKIKKKHLLNLLAWPGIFTIRLASILGKDELEKELELIEALLIENNDEIQNIVKLERDEEFKYFSDDRISFEKTLCIINKLFKDEKDKDLRQGKIREKFKEMYDEYYYEKFAEFAGDDKKVDKFLEEKTENCNNLFLELYERYEKKYKNQVEKFIEQFESIIINKDKDRLDKLFEEVNKLGTELSKELLIQINKRTDEERVEKQALTIAIELIEICLHLYENFAELMIEVLDSDKEINLIDYLINFIEEQKITINGETVPLAEIVEKLPVILFKEGIKLVGKKITEHRIKNKSQFEDALKENEKYSFYSIPKSMRKLDLVFSYIDSIDKHNIDELSYLFSNYFIIFNLLVNFFKDKAGPIYISHDTIKASSPLKYNIIAFNPASKGRYLRIVNSNLREKINQSNIEKYSYPWLGGTNDLVMDKINRFRTHNKKIRYLSTNQIPYEFQSSPTEDIFLHLHRVKTKEGNDFGIVTDKSEFETNLDYNSAVIAYDINTIRELDYNLWIIQHDVNSSDEKNIGYFFYTDINEDVNIEEKLIKYLYYITKRISSITVTIVESLDNFFNDPIDIASKNLEGYEKWLNELIDVYHLQEEFLRSKKLSRAVYAVNAELFDDDKVIDKLAIKLKRAKKYHDSPELQNILNEMDIELNDIINNTYGLTIGDREEAAKKYWGSRKFKHIQKKDLGLISFEGLDPRNDLKNSRTQLFPKIADDNGYTISGNRGFKILGIPR